MPLYSYVCDDCDYSYEQVRSIHKAHPKKCPNCSSKTGLHQNYQTVSGLGFVKNGPTTIGQQMELNEKTWGRELTQVKQDEALKKRNWKTSKKDLPWWRSGKVDGLPREEKPLDLTKVKNVKKYIETGNKGE